ncbi:MerR family transcriptional regulator [Streptomyces sp. ML-6]|uniref:DNA polymerase III subunit beta family protein n=1 Tax=Streptomyces sp. ML-6 TaxID=2982693 RepID=UPI0024BF283F|nr:MerR family transcriptional regulator [Streptomyces sp. ML-6]MDK0521526.1 MerR family transcriptional regulator [Streptomyces sp. ML-6]
MENDMRSIGEMARDSGLGVSALRFYDRAGVLVPARVDPDSGYRWYGPEQLAEAVLLAGLRRTGMPLADIRLVLAGWSAADTELIRTLLRTHLHRLETGLSEARAEFSRIRAVLERRENPMASLRTTTLRSAVSGPGLAAALDAVRFAAGTDPELPMLHGVLFDFEDDGLRVVATDRYRLAVAHTGATGHEGPGVQVVVPSPLVDAMRALLTDDAVTRLTVDGDRVTLEAGDRQVAGQCLDHGFPDYRRLVRLPAGRRVTVDVPAFRRAVENGPVRTDPGHEQDGPRGALTLLAPADDGTVAVHGDADGHRDGLVALNREFLLHALAAGARDRLVLELGAPTAPVAIRRTDSEDTFSLLMPVRLEN